MNRYLLIAMILAVAVEAVPQAPNLVDGWPYITHTNNWPCSATPVFLPENGDNARIYFNDAIGHAFCFDINAGSWPGWPVDFDSLYFRYFAPLVVDLENDGESEILVSGWIIPLSGNPSHSAIFVLNGDGSLRSGFPKIVDRVSSLGVIDFDNDGVFNIISYSPSDGLIFCWNPDGSELNGWPCPLPSDVIGHAIFGSGGAVGDLDLDGFNEWLYYGLHHIYAIQMDGTQLEGFPIAIDDTMYYYGYWGWPPALADLDDDGFTEIIAFAKNSYGWPFDIRDMIAVYEHTGQMKTGWPQIYINSFVYQNPIPADINNDGVIEMGYSAFGEITFVDINAQPLPGWPVRLYSPEGNLVTPWAEFTVVDINGDSLQEIFFEDNTLYSDSLGPDSTYYYGYAYCFALDGNGGNVPGFPFEIFGSNFGITTNFGYDRLSSRLYMCPYSELSLPSANMDTGFVELYLYPGTTGAPDQWPQVSHDRLMTRNYSYVDSITAIGGGSRPPFPQSIILSRNYPNPFNAVTTIGVDVSYIADIDISIFDLQGRKLKSIYCGTIGPGKHNLRIDMNAYSSGIYFCNLKSGEFNINRKMVLLK